MSNVTRRWVFVAVAAALAALAVAIPVASSAGARVPDNLRSARTEASRLLLIVHVPPGAVALSAAPRIGNRSVLGMPSYDEATPNLVDAHRWWTVQGKATDVVRYVAARMPSGAKPFVSGSSGPRPVYYMKSFSLSPIPGVLAERVLAVSVVQLNSNTVAVRTDGEAVWITPRPASEKVPAGTHEIDIKSTGFAAGRVVTVVGPRVMQIVSWINAMGIGQPGTVNCPLLNGPIVTFVFRAPGRRTVARASGMDFDGTSGECNALNLRIHGRAQPPLIGNVFRRVEHLLGVNFGRSMMPAADIVHDVLRGNGIGAVRFGVPPHAVRIAIDSLLGQAGLSYKPTAAQCGVDHSIVWWDDRTANGLPNLVAYFGHSKFVGYQYGEYGTMIPPRPPLRGAELATARGLRIGDTLARGRTLYGRAFTLSAAQGGTWSVRTARGLLDGYAWGTPRHGDVSWQSTVATIDAGDVGCAALSP